MGNLSFQNEWLRRITVFSILLSIMALSECLILVKRKPVVIALNSEAQIMDAISPPSIEAEAETMARKYLKIRYSWQAATQAEIFAQAKSLVAPQSLSSFEKTMADLLTFSKGKNVSQRVYPTSIVVNVPENKIQVVADRFTEIQGLKAATYLRVNLIYQTGARTADNPWGLYVVKEEEVQ